VFVFVSLVCVCVCGLCVLFNFMCLGTRVCEFVWYMCGVYVLCVCLCCLSVCGGFVGVSLFVV